VSVGEVSGLPFRVLELVAKLVDVISCCKLVRIETSPWGPAYQVACVRLVAEEEPSQSPFVVVGPRHL
jgi:hypothetical protein